jgi:hypothetical protein
MDIILCGLKRKRMYNKFIKINLREISMLDF